MLRSLFIPKISENSLIFESLRIIPCVIFRFPKFIQKTCYYMFHGYLARFIYIKQKQSALIVARFLGLSLVHSPTKTFFV